jgi:hypothetical protein
MLLRAFQLLYVYHKSRGRLHWPYGDAILFAFACAQIMVPFNPLPNITRRLFEFDLNTQIFLDVT